MASWEQQTSPLVKFENSPAESFLSVPGDAYPSLFAVVQTPGSTGTMNPLEIMTPKSFADDGADAHVLASLAMAHSPSEDCEGTPEPDKKQTKKRKSWGQVLPEPKTNLPPRKRAKTEDEKEQRRVERVLRNRRAAQSSRERKRLEVEALERLNKDLQDQLLRSKQANELLLHELNNLRRSTGVAPHSSSAVVTLSQQLFASHGAPSALSLDAAKSSLINELMPSATVNPASLSPELAPVADSDPIEEEEDDDDDDDVVAAANSAENSQMDAATASASLDLTQRPAVSYVDGGASAVAAGLSVSGSNGSNGDDADLYGATTAGAHDHLGHVFDMSASFDADRYVFESGLLGSPDSLDLDNDYLAGDSPAFAAASGFEPLDFADFLNDDLHTTTANASVHGGPAGLAAPNGNETDLVGLADSETPIPSENINLQPHAGASSLGCDDGVLAVGV
jgi:transcriptional activator HAC1